MKSASSSTALLPSETTTLGAEPYVLYADANVRLFVRFDGPATGRFADD